MFNDAISTLFTINKFNDIDTPKHQHIFKESEQLDYEEEVEENKPHRSSKFTSERKPINVINTTDDRKEYQGKNLYQRNSVCNAFWEHGNII